MQHKRYKERDIKVEFGQRPEQENNNEMEANFHETAKKL
jgi:hypothetical protein